MEHNSIVAKDEPPWSEVDKTELPRIAFADQGDPELKSTWKYPHHWVKGGTEKDENGVWKDGRLYLHLGGLKAAWAAAHGARSGQEASDAVKRHLEAHRRDLGISSDADDIYAILPDALGRILTASLTEPLRPKTTATDGIIHVLGPIFTYDNMYTALGYGVSIQDLSTKIDSAVKSGAKRLIFVFDSPGGQLTGISDLARKIKAVKVPKVAYIYGLCASAAYWLASAADVIVASDTAMVGSIGVVVTVDKHGTDAIEYITNSKSPYKRLDLSNDEHRSKLVKLLDALADIFVESVAVNRKTTKEVVERDYGQGTILVAGDALKVGMIDKISGLEEVIMEQDFRADIERLEVEKAKLEFELFTRDLQHTLKTDDSGILADLLGLYGKVDTDAILRLAGHINRLCEMINDLGKQRSERVEVKAGSVDFEEVKKFAADNKLTLVEAAVELERRRLCTNMQ